MTSAPASICASTRRMPRGPQTSLPCTAPVINSRGPGAMPAMWMDCRGRRDEEAVMGVKVRMVRMGRRLRRRGRAGGGGGYSGRMPRPFTADQLASALRGAVQQALHASPRFDPFPNLDLAVLALPRDSAPVAANVLFSREFPQGRVAAFAPGFGAVQGLRYRADARGPDGTSLAWVAGSDWTQLPEATFAPLTGAGAPRFIAPYPASLIKLMVVVAVARLVDEGRADWDEPWPHADAAGALAPSVAQD